MERGGGLPQDVNTVVGGGTPTAGTSCGIGEVTGSLGERPAVRAFQRPRNDGRHLGRRHRDGWRDGSVGRTPHSVSGPMERSTPPVTRRRAALPRSLLNKTPSRVLA